MQNLSKTKIERHLKFKTNPEIMETIARASKNKAWLKIAKAIAHSARGYVSVNLQDLDKATTPGDTVLVIGKVLSNGELTKKIRICSLGISHSAKQKLASSKSECVSILEEIKKNPKAEGLKIIQKQYE